MNWRDPTLLPSDENFEYSGSKQINNNTRFYMIVSYDINDVKVFWRYYLMFNNQTEKLAVISLYDNGEDTTYVDNLLKSIRF